MSLPRTDTEWTAFLNDGFNAGESETAWDLLATFNRAYNEHIARAASRRRSATVKKRYRSTRARRLFFDRHPRAEVYRRAIVRIVIYRGKSALEAMPCPADRGVFLKGIRALGDPDTLETDENGNIDLTRILTI